jgi:ribosome-associated protein
LTQIQRTPTALFDKQSAKDMMDFINQPMDSMVGDEPSDVPPERDELAELVRCIVRAADGRKAENIVAMRVSEVSTMCSFIVILSGNSRPQNQAIAGAVKKEVEEEYELLPGSTGVPEGDAQSGWIVLDYGSVMVHVMTPKSRLYFNIEDTWKDKGSEYMDISDILIPNSVDSQTPSGTMEGVPADEDPFWS